MKDHLEPELLDAYAEGALTEEKRPQVIRHLAICVDCRARLESHRRLAGLAAHLPLEAAPDYLVAKIELRIAQVMAGRVRAQQLRRLGWLSLILAAAGLVLVGLAWQKLIRVVAVVLDSLNSSFITGIWQSLANLSPENWSGMAQAGVDWQTRLVQEVDVVLLAGAILLILAACAGLARMFLAAQNRFPMGTEE
jgi:anti-sigma factor RsiW